MALYRGRKATTEDSQFGALIHEITDSIIPEIPGIKAVNAVDEAGVHPLLLAIEVKGTHLITLSVNRKNY